MFKYAMYGSVLLAFVLNACNTNNQKKNKQLANVADTAKYYPITDFIDEQIRFVELRNFTIEKTVAIGATKLHTSLSKSDFVKEVHAVLTIVRSFNNNKHLYKESVFQDLGTESYTINYTALDTSLPLQRIDVLLSEQTNIIKRLFVREIKQMNDTVFTQQISWLADHSFQISSSKELAGIGHTTSTTVVWNKAAVK